MQQYKATTAAQNQAHLRVVGGSANPNGPELAIPHSVEAEEAVLGSLLLDRDIIGIVAPVLEVGHFFSQARASLYQAFLNLYAEHIPADLVTTRNELKSLGVLGDGDEQVSVAYLMRLMNVTPSPVHVTYYVEVLLKHWLARQLIAECSQTVQAAYTSTGQPGEVLAALTLKLQSLSAGMASLQPDHFLSHEESLNFPMKLDTSGGSEATADPWNRGPRPRFGWEAFDGRDWTTQPSLCLLPATLTTILGRTGGGKTLAAMQIADANAQAGLNVLYFHVELNREQMLARRYCRLSGVSVINQLTRQLSDSQRRDLLSVSQQVTGWPGRVDFVHCPNWPIEKVLQELKARHYALIASGKHDKRGYDLVVLDYLQRLGRPDHLQRASEHESLAYNVRSYSDAANELNLAALMTSQVGRSSSDLQTYEPPQTDEGLGSGDIERCSNQLLALAMSQDKTAVKWAIRKNTFGEVGTGGELLYDAGRLRFL